ncbi:GTP-binding nuclear protein Ran-related protein [Niveomyces insectorum RCEF 264]|uniref:GTP-binding nuclear protein Ran-related protein n=1 Tax=Niveomyces insectorum RCEF 264 TaxID=1081102 RepID=A0A168AFQ4_9HYPO|nr:GTP-binding nuclear protein Ran-related protein [Niveomyces insectorum RCEF 264]
MDDFLARLGVQAVNYAMRCGIALTSTFALKQCSRLLKTVDDKAQHAELEALQTTLNNKINIISPALDLIEFRSGRGNVFLENAAILAKALHRDIMALGKRLEKAATAEECVAGYVARGHFSPEAAGQQRQPPDVLAVISEIKSLLARIDGDIPLIQLAITASGESLSTSLPPGISPSRLLQASMLLTVGDTQFANANAASRCPVQIGPTFSLSLYMLFLGHASLTTAAGLSAYAAAAGHQTGEQPGPYGLGKGERKPIWQEVVHKARVRLCRTPHDWVFDHTLGYRPKTAQPARACGTSNASSGTGVVHYAQQPEEYAYHLEIIEDRDDGRAHEDDESRTTFESFDGIQQAGIRESIPIHQIAKIFYTDTGRILNVGNADDPENNNSVLLLKRDVAATVPTGSMNHMVPAPKHGEAALFGADIPVLLEDDDQQTSDSDSAVSDDEQEDIDRQLKEEESAATPDLVSAAVTEGLDGPHSSQPTSQNIAKWHFPGHVDPEWLAFEVFVDDNDDDAEGDRDEDGFSGDEKKDDSDTASLETPTRCMRPKSTGTHLTDPFRAVSLSETCSSSTTPSPGPDGAFFTANSKPEPFGSASPSASPFGAVTSSLSLLEMLVRLTSLQEFQQVSHLSIPDHILTFFLEETSTTGLRGEERWKAKRDARQRVGFDPYTDTPTK